MKFQPRDELQVNRKTEPRVKDAAAGGEAHLPTADNKIFPFASFCVHGEDSEHCPSLVYEAEASGPWFHRLNASACSCAPVCECYLGAAAPGTPLPYSHTQQMRPGDKENTIDRRSVFFFSHRVPAARR